MTDPGPLVVSVLARTGGDLDRALQSGVVEGADVLELRLDWLAATILDDPGRLEGWVRAAERPVIAAIHGDEGFGTFGGGPEERVALLRQAADAGAAFVDVDERFADAVGELPCPRILSTHAVPPALDALNETAARLEALRRDPADLIKLVPACGSAEEGLLVLDWLARREPRLTIAFGSGDAASFTRLLAPAFGGRFAYAAAPGLRSGLVPAAPGQLSVDHIRAVWPTGAPGPATVLSAVVGRPIDHSASPVVHGAALRSRGLDAMLVPVAPQELDALWRYPRIAERFAGLSVTAPFKSDALRHAESVDDVAKNIGAANTLVRTSGGIAASNTDAPGVRDALESRGPVPPGSVGLVVGAGGAARAAVHALLSLGGQVVVAARRIENAQDLAASFDSRVRGLALDSDELQALRPAVIVHATPLGTGGEGDAPVPSAHLRPGVLVLDAVYKPRMTSLLARAEENGATAISGVAWFLRQAWLQHVAIFGAEHLGAADETAALRAMEDALGGWLSKSAAHPIAALVGLRCSGKTTVGRCLAEITGARFIDLDEEIAHQGNAPSAGAIIERQGIKAFRVLEEQVLLAVLNEAEAHWDKTAQLTVLSTGGGAVESSTARAQLSARAWPVWLDAPLDLLRERLEKDASGGGRPPLLTRAEATSGCDEFQTLALRREGSYRQVARLRVAVDATTTPQALSQGIAHQWLHRPIFQRTSD